MSRIVLKSDHSLNYFPNNKPNDFTVNIPIKLSRIGHDLKVALVEIIFPLGFNNVRDGWNSIEISNASNRKNPWIYSIDPNFYTPTSLIDEINKKTKAQDLITLELDENFCVISKVKGVHIKLGTDITTILGFKSNEWLTGAEDSTPDRTGAYKNMSLLNVYCNIVEETLIGEDQHQLLRIVNWNYANKNVSSPSIFYTYPYYIPVKHTNVSRINFKITDSLDIPVEFTGDEPLVIILEFQKVE